MTVKDLIKIQTLEAINGLFETARKVPADKLEWKPMETGRSTLDQLQECVQSADWSTSLLTSRAMPDFNEEMMAEMHAERQQWPTIDDCEKACHAKTEKMFAVLDAFPEADLDVTMRLPWGEKDWAFAEIAGIHSWNCTYHTGQINYIQTLYGDKGM